ncbi:gustatory and odorant receptor 24-like [Periplaneta americana]|uniref:gustatory and odorant receptor 24-like n=1 Tax=Periplaneta americana TaxID=6978 RepID=UPI0037E90409
MYPIKTQNIVNIYSPRSTKVFSVGRYKTPLNHSWNKSVGRTYESTNCYYKAMKPFLIVLRTLGLLPYHLTNRGEPAFKAMSIQMLYSVVLGIALTVSGAIMLRNRYKQILHSTNRPFEYIVSEIALSIEYIILIVSPLTHLIECRKKIRFICEWETLQVEFNQVTGKHLTLGLRWKPVLVLLLIIPETLALIFFMDVFYIDAKWWHIFISTVGPAIAWTMIWLFIFTCSALDKVATAVGDELVQYIATNGCRRAYKISQYKYLWIRLSELTKDFGNCNGFSYGGFILFSFVTAILCCYGSMTIFYREINLTNLTLVMSTLFFQLIMCQFCNKAQNTTTKVGAQFQKRLQSVMRQHQSTNAFSSHEVQSFFSTMSLNPPELNLCGFVIVNRALNTSMISQMVTYIIVLMQFQISVHEAIQKNRNGTSIDLENGVSEAVSSSAIMS